MADDPPSFAQLMQQVGDGSQEAARLLVERYGDHIIRIVRRKLNKVLRTQFDSTDFVQAVWASFFALPLHDYRFDRSEALVGFLMNLARNKVVEAVRQRLLTQKYNLNRERPLEGDSQKGEQPLAARQPGPVEIAIAREEWSRLMLEQPEEYRLVLLALADGDTRREAARRLGVNERTVRRIVGRVASRRDHES